jgi:DNA repair exonuclease SbcCD ATPase subunit
MPTGSKNNNENRQLEEIKDLIEGHIVETQDHTSRIDRLDDKIEKLTDAVVAIARAEEKIATLFKTVKHIEIEVDKNNDLLFELEKQTLINSKSVSFYNKLFWITITAFLTVIITTIIL